MAGTIKHRKVSAIADGGNSALVRPISDWNDSLVVAGGTTLDVMVRDTAAADGWKLLPLMPKGYLWGLTLSNNAGDATNDIDIAAGIALDSTHVDMLVGTALTKQLDAAWAVGTAAGGLDTGAIANNTYHVWLIKRVDTGVVDALFSLSASAPTMPANYTLKRRIGSIVRTGAAIKAFVQDGDTFIWTVPAADISAANPGTAAVTRTLTLPTGIRLLAIIELAAQGTGAAGSPRGVFISDLSITDTAPTASVFSIYIDEAAAATAITSGSTIYCRTNTSAQVRSRMQQSDATTSLFMNTQGWIDPRGREA